MKTHSLVSYWYYGWPRIVESTRRWWEHRHETPEQRATRIAESNTRYREIWEQHKREVWDEIPETREVLELRSELDALMDEILGK